MISGRRSYEKKCATIGPCESLKLDWETNNLCTGEPGSQCLQCCQEDLCNEGDFTMTDLNSGSVRNHGMMVNVCVAALSLIAWCAVV